jgi:hypothetical protein
MLRRQEGQIIPALVMIMLSLIVVGMMFFQVGRAAVFSTQAQTGADAVALAGAKNIRAQLLRQLATTGMADIAAVNDVEVVAATLPYQHDNDVYAKVRREGADVFVEAWTTDTLGDSANHIHKEDERGYAKARARVELFAIPGAGIAGNMGPEVVGADPTISEKEWKKLGKAISDPPTCGTGASSNDLVKLGHLLQEHGFNVAENAEMGSPPGPTAHDQGGWHYKCRDSGALDVNHDQGNEKGAIDGLVADLHKLGFRTIWQAEGHFDHIHIDVANSPAIGLGFGAGGSVGALEETTLVVKLVDWDAPTLPFTGFGGAQGAFFGGPPDMKVAAVICQVLDQYHASPKVRLSAFETAIVESGVHNLTVIYDHDSLGVFQQRASWGSVAQRTDPRWAAQQYVSRAVAKNSAGESAGQLAQSVQNSNFPERYDQVQLQAYALMQQACGS